MTESHVATLGHAEQLDQFRLDPFGTSRRRNPGVTAVVALVGDWATVEHTLPPLLRAVDRVVVVQHGAAEPGGRPGADRVRDIAATTGSAHRLTFLEYPFALSAPGHAHLDTPPDSVHSLVHFHNWAFSHVRTTYAISWDAALVLTPEGEALLADFSWQVGHHHVALRLPRHPLYVESDRVAYLDLAWANVEPRGHPVTSGYSYVKGFRREVLRAPAHTRAHALPVGSCLLVRDLDELQAEPSPDLASAAGREVRRERYAVDTARAIRAGRWHVRRELHRLEAPVGTHVVDHATGFWSRR